jgi:predicted transcriptional regulator
MSEITIQQLSDGGVLAPCEPITNNAAPDAQRAHTAGRFATLNEFVDRTMRDLRSAEVKVWLALYRDCKANGTARTAQSDLARRSGLDVRTIQRAIGTLRKRGLVEIVRRGTPDGGPSTYKVRATRSRQNGAKPPGKTLQKVPA